MASHKDYPAPSVRTPGPWTARSNMSGVTICNPEGVAVAKTPCCDRQAVADGALLAAAPDLLKALVRAERKLTAYVPVCAGDKELTDTVLPMARDAIAKAEAQPS